MPSAQSGEFYVKYLEWPFDSQEVRDKRAHDKLLPDAVAAGFADVEVITVNRNCALSACKVEAFGRGVKK